MLRLLEALGLAILIRLCLKELPSDLVDFGTCPVQHLDEHHSIFSLLTHSRTAEHATQLALLREDRGGLPFHRLAASLEILRQSWQAIMTSTLTLPLPVV